MLERGYVKMPNHDWSSSLLRAVWMATSSARMMVRHSSHLAASIKIIVNVGMCTTAAPRPGWPLMSDPYVYRKKERNPLQRKYYGEHRCLRGVYIPILEGWVSKLWH